MGAWLPLCLLSAALAAAAAASGACVYQGLLFENNTIWKPDSCQDCSCHSNVVTCEPTVCKHPHCDFQKGEVLQIAPNKCCPECASQAEGFCQHEGQIHSHGTQWASSGCVLCSCAYGKVSCTPTACPVLTCGRDELQYTAHGACCPTCVGLGEPCYFDGRLFRDGEDWRLGLCSKCVCRDGVTQCFTASCEAVLCKQVRTQQPSGDTTHDCLLSLGKIYFSCKHKS